MTPHPHHPRAFELCVVGSIHQEKAGRQHGWLGGGSASLSMNRGFAAFQWDSRWVPKSREAKEVTWSSIRGRKEVTWSSIRGRECHTPLRVLEVEQSQAAPPTHPKYRPLQQIDIRNVVVPILMHQFANISSSILLGSPYQTFWSRHSESSWCQRLRIRTLRNVGQKVISW